MAGTIQLEVVTPEKLVVSEEATIVMAPGAEGEFGVLPGHTPFLTSLTLGTLRYRDTAGTERCVFINGGFAEALPDRVTVLAQSAERRCDIDINRAKAALERAKKRLEHPEDAFVEPDMDFERAKAALARAQTRMSLAETRRNVAMQ
ncbi:MAG: F0F1 ATP synthase subunit epsilon [Desulfatibacillaceae bacterium]|nr:F0F1 ATP synthase subunit epsilon [Desulfatibacillaceae bacterium]